MDRYIQKPFLRFLDCFVLSSIGHLDENREHTLNMMAPRLSELLNKRGSWFDIVSQHMRFENDFPQQILSIWNKGVAKATKDGFTVDPEEFARQFVDANFPI